MGSQHEPQPSLPAVDLDDLLLKSSRTFALSIPLLPEPTRREVTVAYLLFRIADTFEDATRWPQAQRRQALAVFESLLQTPTDRRVQDHTALWMTDPPVRHAGYEELLAATPAVLDAFEGLRPDARAIIREHLTKTAQGMARFVAQGTASGELHLASIEALQEYCYIVAGIVGEMLTELYVLGHPPAEQQGDALRGRARAFGEGLQLVNILKDAQDDSVDGRSYLPPAVPRATVFALARQDLQRAGEYTRTLQATHAPRGLVAFNALPVLLAEATLDHVEKSGPGTKVSRSEVFAIIDAMNARLDAGHPVVPMPA